MRCTAVLFGLVVLLVPLVLPCTVIAQDSSSTSYAMASSDDTITDMSGEDHQWRFHAALKFWYSDFTRSRIFESIRGDQAYEGDALVGGVALALSKGEYAVSLSFLTNLDPYDAETYYTSLDNTNAVKSLRDRSEIRTYYTDIRFHKILTENINAFIGYKFVYYDWEGLTDDFTSGFMGHPYTLELSAHGPGLGMNGALPIANTKLSIYGSFFLAPYAWSSTKHSNGFEINENSWLFNPEAGLRYLLFQNVQLSVGYRWEANGSYQSGPSDIIHGPTFDISASF